MSLIKPNGHKDFLHHLVLLSDTGRDGQKALFWHRIWHLFGTDSMLALGSTALVPQGALETWEPLHYLAPRS